MCDLRVLLKYVAVVVFPFFLFSVLFGCATKTTKPNISILDNKYIPSSGSQSDKDFAAVRAVLAELSLKNELLAIELGKLPELQDGVTFQETEVLHTLLDLYREDPDSFDKVFEQMYQVGLPEVRKYCSPLQAIFWLIEDGKIEEVTRIIDEYYPYYLLRFAWHNKEKSRWRDFYAVTERLNAPELVHYYVQNNFTYTRGPINGYWENAYSTFRRKNGHCIAYARFGDYCLKKAGYKTFIRSVNFPGDPCCSDHTASGIILGDGSYLLVVDSGASSMTRHESVESLDIQIAHGNRIIGTMWGHKRSVDW